MITLMAAAAQPEVLAETHSGLGILTLNRPQALNALNLAAVEAMSAHLAAFEADPEIHAVLVLGSGERAFCAGGDVRALYYDGLQSARKIGPESLGVRFFRAEYRLNRQIACYAKPFVALIDGITMGGGLGISAHGRFRIATERTVAAMPEMAIGLFPDVGATHFLNRAPGALGLFLALTGHRVTGGDLLHAKLATHMIAAAHKVELITTLKRIQWSRIEAAQAIEDALPPFLAGPGDALLSDSQSLIDRCFGADSVEAIVQALAAENGPIAAHALHALAAGSPTSQKIAYRQLQEGRFLSLEEALRIEFRLAVHCCAGHDFAEGVRAVLVDKDHAPRWQPARLDAVTEAMVDAHFAPLETVPELRFD
jgi:enoyl-CoA hydratase